MLRRTGARVLALVETRWAAPTVFAAGVLSGGSRRSRCLLRAVVTSGPTSVPTLSSSSGNPIDLGYVLGRTPSRRSSRERYSTPREARSPSRRCRSSTHSRSPRGFSPLGASAPRRVPRRDRASRLIRATGSSSMNWRPTRSSRRPSQGGRSSPSSRCSIRARCGSASSESALRSSCCTAGQPGAARTRARAVGARLAVAHTRRLVGRADRLGLGSARTVGCPQRRPLREIHGRDGCELAAAIRARLPDRSHRAARERPSLSSGSQRWFAAISCRRSPTARTGSGSTTSSPTRAHE